MLFSMWTIVYQCIRIIEKIYISVLDEGTTQGLDDTTITTNILLNF